MGHTKLSSSYLSYAHTNGHSSRVGMQGGKGGACPQIQERSYRLEPGLEVSFEPRWGQV